MLRFSINDDLWLSSRLGVSALRVGADGEDDLSVLQTRLAVDVFAYARVPAVDVERSVVLQSLGFRVIDTGLGFEMLAKDVRAATAGARFATAGDKAAVAELAGRSFIYSRFHLDPAIPVQVANMIKHDWAANFFVGKRGDAMIVAEIDGKIAGFLQLICNGANVVIDLIATAPEYARRGVASSMIGFLARQGSGRGAPERILVSTQAANIPSCRLYESVGFRLAKTEFTLHFHNEIMRNRQTKV